MMTPMFDRVRGIAADVLQTPVHEITLESCPQTIEIWDSVQHLNLVLALEEEFGVQFEPEEIDGMSSIDRILAVLEARRADQV